MANEKIKKSVYKKWWFWTIVVVVVLFGLMSIGDDEETAENDENEMDDIKNGDNDSGSEEESEKTSAEEEKEDEDDSYFDGKKLVTDDFTIEITDYKVLQPGEGDNDYDEPIIAFWYDTTANEDIDEDTDVDPSTAWILTFTAIQDNDPDAVNELDVGIIPDDDHLDSQDKTIKPGGTVSSSVSYELTDDETPVTLIAMGGTFSDDELGSEEYSIK